ncbi:DUF2971 domain-containing protein [Vibrio vulnificus]|uniref:DUF2971 domain-containing protein n=1 Tax=Vibrio vulnificus TaxID=672 RepID=UPI00405874F3
MILYKYVGFQAAISMIESATLGFSRALDLNDPFECTSICASDNHGMTDNLVVNAIKERLSAKFGVLSLTRQPLNSLMWAHYGQSHTGVVIGIDCKKAGLTDPETSSIPVSFGDVIYSATKPSHSVDTDILADNLALSHFEPHSYNLLSRAFLHKSLEWGYEEEVRVVKDITDSNGNSVSKRRPAEFSNQSGNWKQILIEGEGRTIPCLKVPQESFVKVYIGRHAYKHVSHFKNFSHEEFQATLQGWADRGIEVHGCRPDVRSWKLDAQRLEQYS